MSCKPRHISKFISFFGISLSSVASFNALCIYRGDESFYSKFLMPFVSKFLDPEFAHNSCIFMTKHKLIRCQNGLNEDDAKKLKTKVFDMSFENPIGVAAGFDKNSQAVGGLNFYGLGFAEVGTVTPKPQDGNPKQRIFRVTEDKALINRCGFNNRGIEFVRETLSKFDTFKPMLVGLNIGKNKDTSNISSDYLIGLERSQDLKSVDYLVVNISSPNTPGLRDSQEKENLSKLLDDVLAKMNSLSIKKPLLVKVAPDLTDKQLEDIALLLTKKRCGEAKVSGIILTNTTVTRPTSNKESGSSVYKEAGGLSGQPLRDMSTEIIGKFYKITNGKLPIIGVGGVFSGQDAYDKIKAGASLIQIYTSLTYEGPPIVNKIKRELVALLDRDNLTSVEDAVGLNHRKHNKKSQV